MGLLIPCEGHETFHMLVVWWFWIWVPMSPRPHVSRPDFACESASGSWCKRQWQQTPAQASRALRVPLYS